MHPRNRHNDGYNFNDLVKAYPKLSPFVRTNEYQNLSIDFSSSEAVKALNAALLVHHYQVQGWDIPDGFLCPPIPGRVDYIHYLADLLKATNNNKIPHGNKVNALDIGTGASCIYPILGQRQNGWHFVASDIDPISIASANKNIANNDNLTGTIECRLQENNQHIFTNIIKEGESFAVTLCNPPFHSSLVEATKGSERKWQNLNKSSVSNNENENVKLNFGGQKAELWCDGGELKFIRKMINESKQYQQQVLWFSCLVSKSENVKPLKLALKKSKAVQIKVIKMAQGNKISRFIAWSFLSIEQQQHWCAEHF
ncbi:23S rRNA (adenine(1618)-N(6))-methyltransferase RlmF [Thalassotalea nanhaiensis]|uniref:Ribosomal RNA large subunit methyltransferase F n=1 Tax=Thalassotalea nanhaiensis TaxID=3065648 RepID=A0ABY9TFZ4_9GAMM|nr:23S rRNA (adenine(1618)-N(6))-methyltransferase RlmF [Colwelliaceae bacterium SQ345]